MPRFFTTDIQDNRALITGADAMHISKSLRMRTGEALVLCDGQGFDYSCEIISVSPAAVELSVLEKTLCESESKVKITLYQALPKSDKLDFIVQKAVELGTVEIIPVLTERCISRPDSGSMNKKRLHLQKTALEAAKQSGRGIIPEIGELHSMKEAVSGMKRHPLAILFYEQAKKPLHQLLPDKAPSSTAIFIGSEGGFSPEEAAYACENGIAIASLGNRILRCETAPVCALSALSFAFGEF